jgi:hypothetical protein
VILFLGDDHGFTSEMFLLNMKNIQSQYGDIKFQWDLIVDPGNEEEGEEAYEPSESQSDGNNISAPRKRNFHSAVEYVLIDFIE